MVRAAPIRLGFDSGVGVGVEARPVKGGRRGREEDEVTLGCEERNMREGNKFHEESVCVREREREGAEAERRVRYACLLVCVKQFTRHKCWFALT